MPKPPKRLVTSKNHEISFCELLEDPANTMVGSVTMINIIIKENEIFLMYCFIFLFYYFYEFRLEQPSYVSFMLGNECIE